MSHRRDPQYRSVSPVDESGDLPAVDHDNEDMRDEIRKTVAAMMPWGVSIVAHVALIVLGFFLVWQTLEQEEEREPVATSLVDAPEGPTQLKSEDLDQQAEDGGAVFQPVVATVEPTVPTFPGFGEQVLRQSLIQGTGVGTVAGPGVGDGLDKGLFGQKTAPANRIVYIIDASGSMVDVLPFVIDELSRVVDGLGAERQATVLFFSGSGVFEVPGGGVGLGLRALTPAFKQQIRAWASLENHNFPTGGRGSAFVNEALIRGLSYQPDAVFLLSDNLTGGGQGATEHELFQDDLLDLIHENNARRGPLDGPAASIHTIQFLYADPLVQAGLQGTLQRISEETNGQYKFLDQSYLHLQ